MFTISPKEPIKGPLTVEGESVVHAEVQGDVTVPRGACLKLQSRVTGDITVKRGGRAVIHDLCAGGILFESTGPRKHRVGAKRLRK